MITAPMVFFMSISILWGMAMAFLVRALIEGEINVLDTIFTATLFGTIAVWAIGLASIITSIT